MIYIKQIINNVEKNHPLFSEATDGRGVAYERVGEWKKAEKDLLASLRADPNQAYVINYLAYSWIEKGIKIEKSLNMLAKYYLNLLIYLFLQAYLELKTVALLYFLYQSSFII